MQAGPHGRQGMISGICDIVSWFPFVGLPGEHRERKHRLTVVMTYVKSATVWESKLAPQSWYHLYDRRFRWSRKDV